MPASFKWGHVAAAVFGPGYSTSFVFYSGAYDQSGANKDLG